MGANKRDWEDRVIEKSEELAQERYNTDFSQLSPPLQMKTWLDAEHEVNDQIASEMDALRDRIREQGIDHWAELELGRRLGK
ncbi:MAG: hypothetical protein ABR958_01700 [Dehalococcoidales bacterium]|jgi:hypothetical protein